MTGLPARLALLALILLTACAREPEVTRTIGTDVLAPFEDAGWPEYLQRLDLPQDRDYVILAYVPPAHPIDLSTPENGRTTLRRMIFDPLGAVEAGTLIGHLIVGWQCGETQGMTSMTGEQTFQGQKMLLSGWGLTPILSTFKDGELVALADFPTRHQRALLEGRGVVVASEVARSQCEAARREVVEFATHHETPHLNYSLLLSPGDYEGGGCLSFAMHVAGKAGVMPRLEALVQRDVNLRAVQLGWKPELPDSVEPYNAPNGSHPQRKIGWLKLISQPWNDGPVVDQVRVPDGEAIMAAMTYARIGTAPKDDWRYSRLMTREDPIVGEAAQYGLRWAYSYPVRRIADPGGVDALILERR